MDAGSNSEAKGSDGAKGSGGAEVADLAAVCVDLSRLSLKEDEQELQRELSQEEKAKREIWAKLQEELKKKLVEEDSDEVCGWRDGRSMFGKLKLIAGVDISFDKDDPFRACAMMAVLSFPSLTVLHVTSAMVDMTEPYIPGFLAFREVGFLMDRLEEIRERKPHLVPQAIMVDGNGVLHPRGFGLASHLGVLSGIPCIGVGKKLFLVDGLEKGASHKERIEKELHRKGDKFFLKGKSGRIWGANMTGGHLSNTLQYLLPRVANYKALRTSDGAHNPVYVSIGHKISLETAVRLTEACSIKRVPEPIRQADLKSRKVMRT